jgi:5-methylcytosine-specific restriction endonuclease McrA
VKKSIPEITREQVIEMFKLQRFLDTNDTRLLCCGYCNKQLKHSSETSHPYKDVPSIDHMIPQTSGGLNKTDNLMLCCHECNILKSTLNDDTYRWLLALFKSDGNNYFKDKYFREMWKGRITNKMDRLNNQLTYGRYRS